jgi:hypothetical protein
LVLLEVPPLPTEITEESEVEVVWDHSGGTATAAADVTDPTAGRRGFVRRDEHGATMVDTRSTSDFVLPKVLYAESTPRHMIENTGPATWW